MRYLLKYYTFLKIKMQYIYASWCIDLILEQKMRIQESKIYKLNLLQLNKPIKKTIYSYKIDIHSY